MPAILVEDDASGWYESGVVKDMAISRNTFIQCGEAVIQIVPHAPQPEGNVHENITITGSTNLSENEIQRAMADAAAYEAEDSPPYRQRKGGEKHLHQRREKHSRGEGGGYPVGSLPFYRCRETCTVTETLSVRGRMNLRRVTIT